MIKGVNRISHPTTGERGLAVLKGPKYYTVEGGNSRETVRIDRYDGLLYLVLRKTVVVVSIEICESNGRRGSRENAKKKVLDTTKQNFLFARNASNKHALSIDIYTLPRTELRAL